MIPSSFFFELRATLAGERGDLRSGTYHLQQGMSYGAVLKVLTTAPPAAKMTNLTIIEGKTRHQVDALLRTRGCAGSYSPPPATRRCWTRGKYGAPHATELARGLPVPRHLPAASSRSRSRRWSTTS